MEEKIIWKRGGKDQLTGQFLPNPRPEGETHRECNRCREIKEVAEFSGTYRICKPCKASLCNKNARTQRGRWNASKHIAKTRGLEWNIAFKDYDALRVQPCHYCGDVLAETGIGLDRVNSSHGYIMSNVVPCCSDCNRAKGASFTYAEMLMIGKAIAAVKACRQEGDKREHFHRRIKPEYPVAAAPPVPSFFGSPLL